MTRKPGLEFYLLVLREEKGRHRGRFHDHYHQSDPMALLLSCYHCEEVPVKASHKLSSLPFAAR